MEDANMAKQSDDRLRQLYKDFKDKDQSSHANKHMTKRIEKEMKKRGIQEEVEIDEKFAGWIAMYGGKKLEIKKSEADGIWPAKQLAIKHFKVPKSKQGLLAIKPAHEEVEVDEH